MSRFTSSNNPVLNEKAIEKSISRTTEAGDKAKYEVMTVDGAVNKTFVLFSLMILTAVLGFLNPSTINIIVGAVGGLIAVLITVFKPHTSTYMAPVYALLEGLFVGSISAMYASAFEGIVIQAAMLTFGTLFLMLFIYKTGIIKVTKSFRTGIIIATGAIFLIYLASFVLSFFGIHIPYIHEGGMMGIGFSVVVLGIAALNLLLDFDNFDKGEAMGAPKYYEWFFAMGLLITIVWIYIEFLRLLAKLRE